MVESLGREARAASGRLFGEGTAKLVLEDEPFSGGRTDQHGWGHTWSQVSQEPDKQGGGVEGLRGFGTRQRRRIQKTVEVMTQNMSKTSCPPKLLHTPHPRSRTSWK